MSSVKSRREQYSEATRAALLETATRMFAERGFAGTALDDVATATQVTRGAVYHHFSSKKALFEAVFEVMESDAMRRVAEAAAGVADPWESAMVALNEFLERCCDPLYGRLVWHEGPVALGWHGWKLCEEKFAYGLVEQMLGALVESGHIEPTPMETTTRFAFSLLGAAGMLLADAEDADKARVREECAQVMSRLLSGLRPPAT
ncbi:transcriptional regulator, TetR family [Amycolatopsis marina]|uniref:Transcriptional regulator, TetR family n=1 Tax=Amycolatopsis marina TaxID=490629 RepID=A0A1I0YNV3_9PSEU|nr:TetR/AcrR family transcriptional regulator [Amycolatopsis marina]SFB15069.1 transcriptional regulator, TetR family [Amycolatopsis marina]